MILSQYLYLSYGNSLVDIFANDTNIKLENKSMNINRNSFTDKKFNLQIIIL